MPLWVGKQVAFSTTVFCLSAQHHNYMACAWYMWLKQAWVMLARLHDAAAAALAGKMLVGINTTNNQYVIQHKLGVCNDSICLPSRLVLRVTMGMYSGSARHLALRHGAAAQTHNHQTASSCNPDQAIVTCMHDSTSACSMTQCAKLFAHMGDTVTMGTWKHASLQALLLLPLVDQSCTMCMSL